MKHNPFDARCVFVDGPVAVFVHEAAQQDILDSYARIARYVAVAAEQLDTGKLDDASDNVRTAGPSCSQWRRTD